MIIYTVVRTCDCDGVGEHLIANMIRSFTYRADAELFTLECDGCTEIVEHKLDGLIDVTTDSDESQRLMKCEVYANEH